MIFTTGKVLSIVGTVLSVASLVMGKIADQKEMEKTVAKEVAKALANN